jgi:hypothetical protein
MPRIVGPGSSKLRLSIVAAVIILFAFVPLSHAFLSSVDGSFAPSPYSSLTLSNSAHPAVGFEVGDLVPVLLTNHTGSTKTYHWNASQRGVVVSLGEITLRNASGVNIDVPTHLARSGRLRIGLTGTDVFVTVPLQPS